MATHADAELILKLYTIRTEETMRKARHFVGIEFNPATFEELRAVQTGLGTQENAYYRQVMSYWEMAASFVLRGAVDPDLFFESNSENLFLCAKFHHFQEEHEQATGRRMMARTGKLIEKFPAARAGFEGALKAVEARRAKA
ncbi:hypothetical protein FTO74_02240 [Granulicella sp. WH15]|uniref:DUF4760 domain-containing protein n=1 Tax=Granulicella sp. WH15 TaxID=2602070 RepID=UPI001366D65B|nr:hypothetical protein [Granulicella sp. WH15]QHN02320.1 hypothetical protein FTO74_02240 [Granulicella sp. WH15]